MVIRMKRLVRGKSWLAVAAVALLVFAGIAVVQLTENGHLNEPSASSERVPEPGGDWRTDMSRRSVPLDEIESGCVPRDCIPSIDDPRFVSVDDADFLNPREPVIAFGERAYPLQILLWHEIVNDVVGDMPVAITFCPLCNTAIVFDRRIDGRTLEFGVSGKLRHSDLVMYDRQTETWWQQYNGEAIVGTLTGSTLRLLPSALISFEQFANEYPDGEVLSTDTGYDRSYGENPYAGYDRLDSPALFGKAQPNDDRLPPKARVVMIPPRVNTGRARIYPLEILRKQNVVNDDELVLMWIPGTTSALDERQISNGADVGSATVFSRAVDGQTLTFERAGARFRDRETQSTWNHLGRAEQGPMRGRTLTPVEHVNVFWFAVAAFDPNADLYTSDD